MSPEWIDRSILLVHVIAGTLTILSGIVAMRTHKGGKNHRRAGLTFFWSMFIIFISALATMFLFRFNPFLFGISILAFYMTFTGYRVTYRKRGANGQNAKLIDWVALILATTGGLYLLIWGVMVLGGYGLIAWTQYYGVLGIVFGIFILYTTLWEDARAFRQPVQDRQWWWYYHMDRMLGGMIGAVTALLVQQLGDIALLGSFSWIPWVLPGVIGALGINYWVGVYRRKFNKEI
ncbi:MAG: hypothetical protein WBC91_11070 [Phototrophicaceae bacterium]